jgi:RNA polymerase sigma factor (sigma-70 family)
VTRPRDIEDLLREAAPQVLAAVLRRFGDFADSEDAVQEAMLAAMQQWPRQGTPDNPVGWLVHVASRRMVDQARSESARRAREAVAAGREPRDPQSPADHDDTLTLMFMSCHRELTPASAIALTLRAVGGLSTTEIANAFLVPEATMAQRISRAKQTIRSSAVPFRMPRRDEWAEGLRSVLHVLYLIFNEGYLTTGGPELARSDLSGEAIRLTRIVRRALPDDPEVAGLLALMLLTEARRQARADPSGELIPLAQQDRSLWDRDLIAEGLELIAAASSKGPVGEYLVQAQIAALHDQARRTEDTNWDEIAGLYGLLERMTGNPMVSLNRAIAVAMVDGPSAGLSLLEPLSEPLAGHHRLHAVRAHLLEMAGEVDAAIAEYETAASRTRSVPENHYLTMRAARLNESRAGAQATKRGSDSPVSSTKPKNDDGG